MCRCYIILLCVLNIGVVSWGKETEAHGSSSRFSKFIQRLKRLDNDYQHHQSSGSGGYNSQNSAVSSQHNIISACSTEKLSPQTNTIIRSSASIQNGAKYIRAHSGIKSSTECFNLCCQDPACDTSIYEEKDDHRCYLFDCEGLCLFKQHANYTVWDVERQTAAPPEEEELANLHSDNKDNDDDERQVPENHHDGGNGENNVNKDKTVMSPTPAQKLEHVAPHTAGLSDHCTSDVSCEDPNAGCYTGVCHCKEGFYNKDGLCRKECQPSDFGCLGLGTTGRGPECIPKSQICDSYMQCADGSDEFNCDSQVSNSGAISWNNAASAPWMRAQDPSTPNRNKNVMIGQQMMQGTQPVLQGGVQELPAYGPSANYDISTPPEEPENHASNSVSNQRNPINSLSNQRNPVNSLSNRRNPSNSLSNQMNPSNSLSNQRNPSNSLPNQRNRSNFLSNQRNPSNSLPNRRNPSNSLPNQRNPSNSLPNGRNRQNINTDGVLNSPTKLRPNSHSILTQPPRPSMDDRKSSNQPGIDSFLNSNSNTLYHQPTDMKDFQNMKTHAMSNNQNYNPNAFQGSPSKSKVPINRQQGTNTHSNTYTGSQGQPVRLGKSQPIQDHNSNIFKESSHVQNPAHVAYSESGPFREMPDNSVRNQKTKDKENQDLEPQRYNSHSGQPPFPGSSDSSLAPHATDISNGNQDKNDLKGPQNPQQRLPGRMKNPLTSLSKSTSSIQSPRKSKPSSDKSNSYKDQQNLILSSKTKVSSHIQPEVGPNYQSSLLSSPSSSRQPSRQGWLGSNSYLNYGNQRQRQQVQPSRSSPYYEPSQYFSQYNTNTFDSLPPSLLGDTGSQDDFSQYGGSYIDRQKPHNRLPYALEGGNLGYGGYSDSTYNSQYNPSNRYNYGGDYGTSNYQDPDYDPTLRNSKGYHASGIYEDLQSNPNPGMPGYLPKKNKGLLQPNNKVITSEESKSNVDNNQSASSSDSKGSKSKGPIPQPSESTSNKDSTSESVKNKSKAVAPTKDSKLNLTHATSKKPHSSVSHNKVFVTQEKVIIASSTSEAEGPIIALALGLAFTLILIVLLGCRLRNMKHRLKKGRPLNSNEADYLINGMYL